MDLALDYMLNTTLYYIFITTLFYIFITASDYKLSTHGTSSRKTAKSLEILHSLKEKGVTAIKSSELTRVHRERLTQNGFIKEVTHGWYIPSHPDEKAGDTTSWYASYWDFCSRFLNEKYGDNWIVSAEQSVLLQADNWSVPQQLLLKSPQATNYGNILPANTSLFSLKMALPSPEMIEVKRGIRMYALPASLVFCSPHTFVQNAVDARALLASIRDASEVLRPLLAGGHSTYAGRLAGAFRNIGKDRIADEILATMKGAGYDVREADPFTRRLDITLPRERSPYANRIRLLWEEMREVVIKHFPPAPGISPDHKRYLKEVDEVYVTDAYHSLSIERYRVSPELIERVQSGKWDLNRGEDRQQRDAMAARGYWQAFQQVKESISKF